MSGTDNNTTATSISDGTTSNGAIPNNNSITPPSRTT